MCAVTGVQVYLDITDSTVPKKRHVDVSPQQKYICFRGFTLKARYPASENLSIVA